MNARARRRAGGLLVALVVGLAGCTMLSPESRAMLLPASRAAEELLVKADALAARGDDSAAISAYSEVAIRYPDTLAATRARVLRDALAAVQKLRADLRGRDTDLRTRDSQLRVRDSELRACDTELAGVRRELAAREGDLARAQSDVTVRDLELVRLRGEVAARQSDVTRLSAESERLRADLDQLKRIDLRLEQDSAKRR